MKLEETKKPSKIPGNHKGYYELIYINKYFMVVIYDESGSVVDINYVRTIREAEIYIMSLLSGMEV